MEGYLLDCLTLGLEGGPEEDYEVHETDVDEYEHRTKVTIDGVDYSVVISKI